MDQDLGAIALGPAMATGVVMLFQAKLEVVSEADIDFVIVRTIQNVGEKHSRSGGRISPGEFLWKNRRHTAVDLFSLPGREE
jgi:hypothetical protein